MGRVVVPGAASGVKEPYDSSHVAGLRCILWWKNLQKKCQIWSQSTILQVNIHC